MKKKKKKPLITLVIIGVALIAALLIGYSTINLVFDVFTDSFYRSVISTEEIQKSAGETITPEENQSVNEAEQDASPSVPPAVSVSDGDALFKSLSIDKLNLTAEEFKAIQKKIPFNDKVAVLNILSTGLSGAEYKELIGMLGSGITRAEVRRAYQILSTGLSSENKAKIWGYYNKYVYLIQ